MKSTKKKTKPAFKFNRNRPKVDAVAEELLRKSPYAGRRHKDPRRAAVDDDPKRLPAHWEYMQGEGRRKQQKKKKRFLVNLEKSMGIVAAACQMTGIHRSTYYGWIAADPDFRTKATDVEEHRLDHVESKLLTKIGKGDAQAIMFYLRTKGRRRGYGESTALTGPNGGAIQHAVLSAEYLAEELPPHAALAALEKLHKLRKEPKLFKPDTFGKGKK